jgi:hypothetical protein
LKRRISGAGWISQRPPGYRGDSDSDAPVLTLLFMKRSVGLCPADVSETRVSTWVIRLYELQAAVVMQTSDIGQAPFLRLGVFWHPAMPHSDASSAKAIQAGLL